MKTIYSKWDEVPIKIYREIKSIVEQDSDDTQKSVALIACLCGVDEEEIWALPLPEVSALSKEIGWVFSFDFDKKNKPHKLRIANREYIVCYDVTKMSIAAYVDFQTYFKKRDEFMGALLTTFVLPKGYKYAEGYDAAELAREFEREISITTYNTLLYFFLLSSLNSIRAMQTYSDLMTMKMLKNKNLTEAERERITELMNRKREMMATFGFHL